MITKTKTTQKTAEVSKSQEVIKLTTNVCSGVPWKASISRMTEPLVEMRISLPSGLNFNPVQSHSLSCGNLNVANGPCGKIIVKHMKVNEMVCSSKVKHKPAALLMHRSTGNLGPNLNSCVYSDTSSLLNVYQLALSVHFFNPPPPNSFCL